MVDSAAAAKQPNSFVAELEASNLHPLWDRYQRITPIKPQPRDAPFLWRWRDIEPFLHRAVGEVSINDIERRALIMAHPAFGAETTTTSTLLAAFTVLEPGDRARPHRHTGAAIRFATRADGAATIVNGRRCEMKDGDLILTPPMCWHGHINESDHRIIWFDAANMPLIRAVDAHFFEPGDPRNNAFWQVDAGEEELWTEAGLRAEGATAGAVNSPKYRYPGEATRRLLAAAPAARRRHADDPLRQSRDRRRRHADARLLRGAPGQECADAARNARPGTPCAWWSRARAAPPSATRPSNGRGTTSSPSRIGPSRATRRAAATPTSSW